MPFDPLWPQNGQLADGDKIREQFTALKTLIDAGGGGSGVTDAQVDGVNSTDPSNPALAQVSFAGGVLHFTFTLPRGFNGIQGQPGNDGGPGPVGPQGPPFANAIVDSVTTLPAGSSATVSVMFDGSNVRFTFGLPAGNDGAPGAPGEVSTAQMQTAIDAAIATTSTNTNGVPTLNMTVNDPPTAAEVQAVANKIDELILALRRP